MALRSTSYILTCQPLPLLRKCSTISASNLVVNCIFERSDLGGHGVVPAKLLQFPVGTGRQALHA